jgi:hypothetical protein
MYIHRQRAGLRAWQQAVALATEILLACGKRVHREVVHCLPAQMTDRLERQRMQVW